MKKEVKIIKSCKRAEKAVEHGVGDTSCGRCTRNSFQRLGKRLEIKRRIETIQTTALLKSTRIPWRVEKTWGDRRNWWCYIVIFWFMQKYTYIYWIHTDAMITDARRKDAGMKDAWRKTQEDSFTNIFTSHFIARFERVVQGLHVRGSWRPNINFIFWPPLLMTFTLCLSCSLRCSTRGLGVHCWMLAFFTAS